MTASVVWLLAFAATNPGAKPDLGLGWLPADTRSVMAGEGQNAPILKLMSSLTAMSACPKELLRKVSGTYQVWREPGDRAAVVLHGDIDRKAWETCAVSAMGDLRMVLRLQQEGDLTQVVLDNRKPWYVGFAPGWLVEHHERARVQQLLSALRRPPGGKALRPKVLAQITKTSSFWGASDLDYTQRPLGVPSRGFIAMMEPGPGPIPLMRFTVFFAKAAQAAAAERALAAKTADEKLPADVRRFLTSLAPQRKQDQLEVTFDSAVLSDEAIMAALQGLADPSKAAEQAKDAAAAVGFSDTDDAPCPAQSSFEMRLAVKSAAPGFRRVVWEGATWFLAPQSLVCARQLRSIASGDSPEGFGPELIANLTPAGKHTLHRGTSANVGKDIALLLGGEVWSISRIASPLGSSDKLRLFVNQANRDRVAAVVKQISAEIAEREPKLQSK